MSSSSAAGARRWLGSVGIFISVLLASLGLMMALSVWRDPYWVFRDNPPWTDNGAGVSRLFDVEMRKIKPLQIARTRPSTLLIGSSVVYRGIDPRHLATDTRSTYNAGISSLMADELPQLAALAAEFKSTRRVIISLDYFMFSGLPPPPPLSPKIVSMVGRWELLVSTVLNLKAPFQLFGSNRLRTEPGVWHANGFKETPDFDADLTRRISAAQNVAAMDYRPQSLAYLDKALERLSARELHVVLSPMSSTQRDLLRDGGRDAELAAWRRDVAIVAANHGLKLHDLIANHPFNDFDPNKGSSRYWLDTMHFKPEVGRWVLTQIGLVKAEESELRNPRLRDGS